ncbi:Hypothetical predicted protein [Mytilus galloprovincialis]|uniref:Uncharacterized protein n=1 Tax=Mytilus galloprovincialis TaxID=29158 RepID=A0A8B6G5M6_MYTGA|nr:Hypothetical predicted protein [Mytilus galloprovincialis]
MEPSGSLDEKTGKCEKILGVLKKRSLIKKSNEKKCSYDHALYHQSTTQYDNEGSLSIQSSLDMLNCTGCPPWECIPSRIPCQYGNICQAGQANDALPIQVITDMSRNTDSGKSVCTPPRVPSSDDVARQIPNTYNEHDEKKYENAKFDEKKMNIQYEETK